MIILFSAKLDGELIITWRSHLAMATAVCATSSFGHLLREQVCMEGGVVKGLILQGLHDYPPVPLLELFFEGYIFR